VDLSGIAVSSSVQDNRKVAIVVPEDLEALALEGR